LRTGRLTAGASAFGIRHAVSTTSDAAAVELAGLLGNGLAVDHAALLLEVLLAERCRGDRDAELELVTSGPDAAGVTRDTGVVVRDLFARATCRVLVLGFAVHQGRKIFAALAERMSALPALSVRLCLDVPRRPGDTTTASGILRRFARRLAEEEWPGSRLPEVFYDPRALGLGDGPRASLHAKCVVIDGRIALVGSANLTEAAQLRNIEIGLLARSPLVAAGIERHVDALITRGILRQLPLE
jgi:hypothetical protein